LHSYRVWRTYAPAQLASTQIIFAKCVFFILRVVAFAHRLGLPTSKQGNKQMTERHYAVIEGKKYVLILCDSLDRFGKKSYYIRSVRVQEDGTEIEAFLSNRQQAAEQRAERRFANLIQAHRAS
jgi:hypothetical protein